jgi:hypothetical protein
VQHDVWRVVVAVCSKSAVTAGPFVTRAQGALVMIRTKRFKVRRVDVSGTLGSKEHLNTHDQEDRYHGDQAGHGFVAFVPERREAWVGEGGEGRGQEVHESRRDQDSSAEMPRDEEELVRYGESRKALCDDGEGARWTGSA